MAYVSQPPAPQTLQMKILGLYTNSNELSYAPDGALLTADNIWISKDSIAESRRGFTYLPFALPNANDRADKLSQFENQLLVHYNDSTSGTNNDKLAYYSNSTGVMTYSGSFEHPDPFMARMKFAESNKNIYFTTSTGVFKNDLITNNPTPAGMYQALDCTATISASGSGFLANNAQVAYRVVWGITDANNNLNLGAPSSQAVVSNTSGVASNTSLQITIPAGITINHFFQIYRSDQEDGITSSATLTVQDLTYTAVAPSTPGNSITIAYTTGGTAGAEVVGVSGNAISVKIAAGNANNKAILTVGGLTYTAVATGSLGNSIGIVYTGGATAGAEVVTVAGNIINVQIQGGTSTATQVANAINASPAALGVLNVTVITGSMSQSTMSPAYLNGGSTAAQIAAAIGASGSASALVKASVSGGSANFQLAPFGPTNLSGGSVTLETPDDSCQLVYEANPTSGEISSASITVVDDTPDSLRGAALYTNATQQGILQANNVPPYCLDMCLFETCMFYGNVQTPQQAFLTILSVGGSGGIQLGDTLTISGTTYTAGSSENVSTLTYQLFTSGSPAQNINNTSLSLIRVINRNTTNTSVYAYYLSSTNSLPGQLSIQSRILGGSAFYMTSSNGAPFSPALPTSGTSQGSTNNTYLNGLMYSKGGQPEAVPNQNLLFVGSASKPIRRIIPVRNSLFIFKDDGVFRCTGVAGNFSIDTIDTTIILLAPESAVSLSNQIFCLTTQGVVSVSDNGGPVLSRPIEDQLLVLEGSGLSTLQQYSFGVSYESERQYVLWTISAAQDTFGTQALIYNTFTKTWTRSTRQQSSGIILTADNKMYVTNPSNNKISQERKSYTYQDYSDEATATEIISINGKVLSLTNVNEISIGDLVYQSDSINSLVSSINYSANTVTVVNSINGWTVGSATVLKSIPCLIEWLPNAAGNPGYLRHWQETAIIFKQNLFNNASLNFYSEISAGIDSVPITGNATAGWGQFGWGNLPWGGVLKSVPFRTYVPLEKQRCDLLSIQFQCQNAWSNFQIEGLSCVFYTIGPRMTL